MDRGDADSLGVEIWRGGVNTWECDEMGHMNVRFYVTRAMEGLVGLAAALGMPKAFAPDAGASLLLREQHIRFLREARPGGLLHMRGAVIEMGETDAQVLQVLYHSDTGEPAASFVSRVGHVTALGGRPFAWPRQARERAERLTVAIPTYAAPRGVDLGPFESRASLDRSAALGLTPIALGRGAGAGLRRVRPRAGRAVHRPHLRRHSAADRPGPRDHRGKRGRAAEARRRGGSGIPAGLSGLAEGRRAGGGPLGPVRDRGAHPACRPLDARPGHWPGAGHFHRRGRDTGPRHPQDHAGPPGAPWRSCRHW